MKVALGPNLDWMIGKSLVAIFARIVDTTTLRLNRDDVRRTVIMLAACLRIQIDATHI